MLGFTFPPAQAGDVAAVAQALRAAGRLSDAGERAALPTAPEDPAWEGVPAARLRLYAQQAIRPGLEEEDGPLEAEVRVLTDGTRLALRVAWPDAHEDRYSTQVTDRFADAFAVQFAQEGGGAALPYIGMGEPTKPVTLWFWRAGREPERLTAQGFGTLAKAQGPVPGTQAARTREGWAVVLQGALPVAANPLPLSVAAWDGAGDGRDGRKRLSAWHLVRIPGLRDDAQRYQRLLAENQVGGDPHEGERLARERGCTACHRLPGAAQAETGPDLRFAGGHHWPGYLRRSLLEPSAFIVPIAAYRTVAPGGDTTSLMPPPALTAEEVEHVVAYLASMH